MVGPVCRGMPARCLKPAGPMPTKLMPICADKEALKWMQAYLTETTPELNHDGFMWMLHGDVEDNTTPMVMDKADAHAGHWIESGPHLMLMPKDPQTIAGHTSDFRIGSPLPHVSRFSIRPFDDSGRGLLPMLESP